MLLYILAGIWAVFWGFTVFVPRIRSAANMERPIHQLIFWLVALAPLLVVYLVDSAVRSIP